MRLFAVGCAGLSTAADSTGCAGRDAGERRQPGIWAACSRQLHFRGAVGLSTGRSNLNAQNKEDLRDPVTHVTSVSTWDYNPLSKLRIGSVFIVA